MKLPIVVRVPDGREQRHMPDRRRSEGILTSTGPFVGRLRSVVQACALGYGYAPSEVISREAE